MISIYWNSKKRSFIGSLNKLESLHPKMICAKYGWFVCLGVFVPLENFSVIWRRHHCRWRAANFDLCSAHMAIEQWGFFRVPHLLWHGASVYNGHLRGPVTLTPIAERLAVELSLPVFTTLNCRGWVSNTQPSACGANVLAHCATAVVSMVANEPVILEKNAILGGLSEQKA